MFFFTDCYRFTEYRCTVIGYRCTVTVIGLLGHPKVITIGTLSKGNAWDKSPQDDWNGKMDATSYRVFYTLTPFFNTFHRS